MRGEMGNHGSNTGRVPEVGKIKVMSTLTIRMPEGLAKQLQVCAADEGVTVDQLVASAAAEKLSALMTIEHLRQRAVRADRQDFIDFLEASPDEPPMKGDDIG